MFEPQSQSSQSSPFDARDFASKRDGMAQQESLPGVREVRIVLGAAFFSWLALALLTFSTTDPSLFHLLVPVGVIANWCGAFGAHAAALLYVLFGPAAWGALLFSVFVIPRPQESHFQIMGRGIAILTAMVSAGALFSIANVPLFGPITGGLFGSMALIASQWIGVAGCVIGYSMLMVFSVLWFVRVSINTAAAHVYAATSWALGKVFGALAWLGHWIWAGSSRLWRRKPVEEAETSIDTSFNFGGGGNFGVSDTEEEEPDINFSESKENWQEPEIESYQHNENEDESIASDESATPVKVGDNGHSFMPEDESGDNQLVADQPADIQLLEDQAVAYQELNGGEENKEVVIEEIAEASATDQLEAPEQLLQPESEDIWGAQSSSQNDGSEKYFDIDEQEGEESIHSAVEDAEEDDDDIKKIEIEDDGFDFDAAESTSIEEEEAAPTPAYEPPPVYTLPEETLFTPSGLSHADNEDFMRGCQERGRVLEEKLAHFGISGRVVGIHPGPVITLFEYEPDVGSKVSKIVALEDDLAMSLKALSIRIIAPVPGKCVVGFEIANEERNSVLFADVIAGSGLHVDNHALPIALGSDIVGKPVIADLATMPHLLVAGATGAGKSVGMNVMLTSMLASLSPDKVRMILIDPKRLEFAPYADVPHLLFPIVTSPYEVAPVLKWVVQEMELRYEIMAQAGVRNIADYHKLDQTECFTLEHNVGLRLHGMPYMVIMIDELADLMMVASKEIETLIARIAQMARAAGIHMIVATQRPSVDVVTGLIKANFPSRIAFRVSTKIDSRTIIDGPGAEKLLGKGDMLYLSPSNNGVQRLHGAYVTDEEIDRLTTYLKEQREVEYFSLRQVIAQHSEQKDEESDPLYNEVCEYLRNVDEVSISLLQRKYRVGFNRSARLIEMLERDGHIAPAQGSKPRRVLRD